jgi:hypothetical protein
MVWLQRQEPTPAHGCIQPQQHAARPESTSQLFFEILNLKRQEHLQRPVCSDLQQLSSRTGAAAAATAKELQDEARHPGPQGLQESYYALPEGQRGAQLPRLGRLVGSSLRGQPRVAGSCLAFGKGGVAAWDCGM